MFDFLIRVARSCYLKMQVVAAQIWIMGWV